MAKKEVLAGLALAKGKEGNKSTARITLGRKRHQFSRPGGAVDIFCNQCFHWDNQGEASEALQKFLFHHGFSFTPWHKELLIDIQFH